MTTQKIRETCINSAKLYYTWLEENNKGLQVVDILSIKTKDNKHYTLKLSSKLFDPEVVMIRYLANGKDFSDIFQVVEYDSEKRILFLKKNKEKLPFDFNDSNKSNFKIISSLRFLVKNVEEWYTSNGDKIKLPEITNQVRELKTNALQEIQFETGTSIEQKDSIKMILSSPFSYIWGAPGTGKTRWVLTQAMLYYINKGKKVSIMAPTNNAIEQVLEAIIPIAQNKGISINKFIRLGNPSSTFSEKYPDVCEVRGVQKKIDEINKRINFLKRIADFDIKKHKINKSRTSTVLENLTANINHQDKLNSQVKDLKNKKVNYQNQINDLEIQLIENQKHLYQIIQKQNSLGLKLAQKFFGVKRNYKEEIRILNNTIELSEKRKQDISKYLESTFKELESKTSEIFKCRSNIHSNKEESYSTFGWLFNTTKEDFFKQFENLNALKNDIQSSLTIIDSEFKTDEVLNMEYSTSDISNIPSIIKELENKIIILESYSTEEKLKSVSVVACTLDTYIMRFKDTSLEVDHIFVDEAGYASAIKVLPTFLKNIPITLLGDHKQLPPVCELQDYQILKDKKYYDAFLWHYTSTCIDSLFTKTKDECLRNFANKIQITKEKMSFKALKTTFRFGNNLAHILGKYVYNMDFKSGSKNGNTEIFYINAPKGFDEIRKRESLNEVHKIISLSTLFDKNNEEYAVLTPYRKGQLRLLANELPKLRDQQLIMTVHGSQGKEWNTVILSIVDTSDMFFTETSAPNSIGKNLINTAVSRAKKRLILVGDTNFWLNQSNQLITELMKIGKEISI
ncbi:hypothetical protein NBRC110019_24860 [Neptunitalea chrysea]|uniref:Uncharacterized protein n=1 Tax=Neptunitalea chrysea TaxID=1647581 RepID=A0A9W6B859_9FLAO|nr:AAA domain-containing protein [Neptunitalea chrysea]GLB53445.1 hypothetical protein NBRC110019_24860 [Neptunitalea chrysea]